METKSKLTTLCYIEKDEKYLMLHRVLKKNDINKDKWIGVGGHFEKGESPEDCLLREVKEETGLTLTSYQFRGIITFTFSSQGKETDTEYMCLYTANGYEGELKRCFFFEALGRGQNLFPPAEGRKTILFLETGISG